MITEQLLLKAALSFLVGGLYIGLMTIIAERFGSKIGGLLIALPSTILVSLVFISIILGPTGLVQATITIPAAIGVSIIFLSAFVFLYRFGILLAYFGAVAIWFTIASSLVLLHLDQMLVSILLGLVFFAIGLSYVRGQPHRKLPPLHFSQSAFAVRCLFAGSFVALAVLLAGLLGPFWGGTLSAFPAAFSATVLILTRAHGIEFTTSTAKTMVLGAAANIVFVVGVYYLVPVVGVLSGMALAYLFCLVFAAGTYRFIADRV